MVNSSKHIEKQSTKQETDAVVGEPFKITASTPFDFEARNLTAYGGLLPVSALLEKLGFRQLVEEKLTIKRQTRVMPGYEFVLAMVLALYVGFSRLNHLPFLKFEPMLTGILKVASLPPQCTFWRFLAALNLNAAAQILKIQQALRERVWEAAHIQLREVTIDTDTTVHTIFGHQMGARKSGRRLPNRTRQWLRGCGICSGGALHLRQFHHIFSTAITFRGTQKDLNGTPFAYVTGRTYNPPHR